MSHTTGTPSSSGRFIPTLGLSVACLFILASAPVAAIAMQAAAAAPPAAGTATAPLWHKVPYEGTEADRALADGVRAFNDKDYDLANAAFSRGLEIRPKFADCHYNLGLTFATVKDYDRAIVEFTKVIEAKPKLSDAYVERGRVYLDKGDLDKAHVNADMAIKLTPKNADAIQLTKDISAAVATGKY